MKSEESGKLVADERERARTLLSAYPDMPPEDLKELHNWFDRVATPLDIGLLASDPELTTQYRSYRKDHYDKFKGRHLVNAIIFIMLILMVVVAIGLAAP